MLGVAHRYFMLTDQEKLIIISFIPSNSFQLLKKVIQERINIISDENPERENEFKTILKVGERKGEIKALQELVKYLEELYRKSVEKEK